MRDHVDVVLEQWRVERPDLEPAPMGVVGRISRSSRLLERALAENFARAGLQAGEFDILATLRRSGPPYELSVGALGSACMVTPGAITNRIDHLVEKELVTRETDPTSRRRVLIALTDRGRAVVDDVVADHLDVERRMLASLGTEDQDTLAALLRELLVGLGDVPDGSSPDGSS